VGVQYSSMVGGLVGVQCLRVGVQHLAWRFQHRPGGESPPWSDEACLGGGLVGVQYLRVGVQHLAWRFQHRPGGESPPWPDEACLGGGLVGVQYSSMVGGLVGVQYLRVGVQHLAPSPLGPSEERTSPHIGGGGKSGGNRLLRPCAGRKTCHDEELRHLVERGGREK
jgi:hypothetical protein